ncbi:MAG: L-dopachrome tautomerase-related protein [Acidobacteriota bacterium]|nr:L-dopachrome tautomerase-related protein [Acidobacteriota bacterium]
MPHCFSLSPRIAKTILIGIVSVVPGVLAGELETYAAFSKKVPPGNLAITAEGRIFMSVHGFYGQPVRVVEVFDNGSTRPYPNPEWATAPGDAKTVGLNGVLGLNADGNGILWLLDTHAPNRSGRLIGWNTKTEKLERIIYLAPPVTRETSFLNDLAIDTRHNAVYISDSGAGKSAALIVVDLATGQARRVLEGSPFTVAEDLDMVIDGATVTLGGNPARIGVNPITVDHTFEWVYFAPMTGTSLYRIKTADLLDPALTEKDLRSRVKRYGDKPVSDGITIDRGGNVYITSITNDSIGVTRPDGTYQTLFQRDDLSWPDGFAVGPDDYVYVTINELHRSPVLNQGGDASKGEFKIIRFKALTRASVGR